MSLIYDELEKRFPEESEEVKLFIERFASGMDRWVFNPPTAGANIAALVTAALLCSLGLREEERKTGEALSQAVSQELYKEKLGKYQDLSPELAEFISLFELQLDKASGAGFLCAPLVYLELSKALRAS